ncbi:hypothetical protein BCR33DRAFT_719095 [Rhizoclosmatium globosum]|uniref:L domain-like protein n=1 Tax=Rhizoclosmatium globosum TaxID=329046 RepID=A0A1Y2C1S6_9FUNG|nr:hypothetical protein BCR33DRAFT_719095 [Rhizoclosmatium globosum]|eukprot:ORY40993.1 hypothetical protein BCR33DRAFT_719095 [Rhizoclosmatium globosum]
MPPQFDGCYDRSTGAVNVQLNKNDVIDQGSVQCLALMKLAQDFGFNSSRCLPITILRNSVDNSSFVQALFCDQTTIYSLSVTKPPTSMNTISPSLYLLSNLMELQLFNALFGDSVLNPLTKFVNGLPYFTTLNVTGSTDNTLSGPIPLLFQGSFFRTAVLSNNNLSGEIPSLFGDSFQRFDVHDNPLLSGKLPPSIWRSKSGLIPWTQTQRCDFRMTSVCLAPESVFQPSCIRNATFSVPTCDTNGNASYSLPLLPIDTRDPMNSGSPTLSSSDSGEVAKMLQYFAIGVIILVVGIGGFVFCSRKPYRANCNQRSNAITRGNVEDEGLELPAYTPPPPEYLFEPVPSYHVIDEGTAENHAGTSIGTDETQETLPSREQNSTDENQWLVATNNVRGTSRP